MGIYKEEILYKESRIKILVDNKGLIGKAIDELIKQRTLIEEYIERDAIFKTMLEPHVVEKNAPEIVKNMAEGARIANVGPMAAVAGTIAEFICRKLIKEGVKVVIVENGGDVFAYTEEPIIVGVFSGIKKLANKLAFELNEENTPLAICSSSSLLGHSLSFGDCDLATVFSKKSYIADAVATAVSNKVKNEKDIKKALKWAINLEKVDGVIIIKNDKVGMIGDIPRLIKSDDKRIKEKVTKEDVYRL